MDEQSGDFEEDITENVDEEDIIVVDEKMKILSSSVDDVGRQKIRLRSSPPGGRADYNCSESEN